MSPELQQAFDAASVPFLGGAIALEHTRMKSWRYFLEINSVCNLHCPTCTKGNQEGYEHQTGLMQPLLMEQIIDKIAAENPAAIVFLYGNSEPFLHPQLPECIRAVKLRKLHVEFSTNLNVLKRVDEVLAAQPDMIIISLSGFTQEVYVKGHAGGNIERVKDNMRRIAEVNSGTNPPVKILVNYHVYNDNAHEIEAMKQFAENLGLGFFTSLARAISMENAIQYCRSKDPESTLFDNSDLNFNVILPPVGETYVNAMGRLKIPPTDAREMYKHHPLAPVCPVGAGSIFTFIRHDGKTQLCACTADRRITLKDYLTTTPDELISQRAGHPLCKQCIKYRLNLYFMIADFSKWVP